MVKKLLTQIKHKTLTGEEVVMDIGAKASNVLPENFVEQKERSNLAAKDKLPVIFGKLSKWYTDLKAVAWSGSYLDLTNKPSIPEGSAANYQVANNDTTEAEGFVADARIVRTHGLEIDGLSRDLDVGSDSGMTIGSMVKAIYDKVINSAAISGHLRGGRSRGGSGTGEVTFNNIKKGSTITISSVVIPPGAGEAIKTTVDGDIVITGAGSYTLTKDGTVKIVAHVYLGEEGTSGYAECDFKIV